jgi:NTP pyrophosphatase (non-canonical NTP hydrolase)
MGEDVVNGNRVTVSGSFTKHWPDVTAAMSEFERSGFSVLSPKVRNPARTEDGFVFLEGEVGKPKDIEQRHLEAIGDSDLLYVVGGGEGYFGRSVALEIGYALANGVPVWASEPLAEIPHRDMVRVGSVRDAIRALFAESPMVAEVVSDRLQVLQRYYAQVAGVRGFHKETPEQVLMLLVEEVGELAKALRARVGVSMSDDDTSRKSVRLELSDCFIYLLHMANITGIDLYSAFREKERLNANKRWSRPQSVEQASQPIDKSSRDVKETDIQDALLPSEKPGA